MAIPVPLRGVVTVATACAAATALAACSSGSSGGGTPTAAQSSAIAAEHSPAVKSESFHHVAPKVAKRLEAILPLQRGVKFDTYYSDTKTLSVTYTSTATKLDQQNVENLVRQAKEGRALPTPTPSVQPSASATATSAASVKPTPTITYHNRHKPSPPPKNHHPSKKKRTHR